MQEYFFEIKDLRNEGYEKHINDRCVKNCDMCGNVSNKQAF